MIVKPRIRGFICTTSHPEGCAAHHLAIMAPPSPPIDEWLESLPPWAQWGIQGSKLLLAFSPIIILIVILVRAFESDEEVRFVSCCSPVHRRI